MSSESFPQIRFRLGRIVATPNALDLIPPNEILEAIQKHQVGDWGDISKEDQNANDSAAIEGSRILSSYRSNAGERFWIITEANRSVTTVLLPCDY